MGCFVDVMLHAFHRGINNTVGEDTTLDQIAANLRKEFLLNNQTTNHSVKKLLTFL